MRSGKALGGSTAINGMAWSKPHDFQLDAFEAVGNAGVNWASLQQYMLRVENFHTPDASQGVTYDPSCRGTGGGIDTRIIGTPAQFEADFTAAVQGLGLPFVDDLTCGAPAGMGPMSHNSFNNIRSDAYRGYLLGTTKPNLTILSGATVGKVILSNDATPRATGVELRDASGQTFTANARREVLMATGSLRTPVILQHSGIGPASFLSSAGVQQRVDLPVGQNLIDQVTTTSNWNIDAAGGGGQPITWPRFDDLFKGADADRVRGMLEGNLAAWAQEAVEAGAAGSAAGLQAVLEIQRDWILNRSAGIAENYDYSYDTTLGWDSWFLLPFGRGSVRIADADAYGSFSIDPRFFANEFDALASGASARFSRTASNASPLVNHVTGERDPGSGTGDSLDAWVEWAKTSYRSNWHPIGTVAMMSQELGGCVDARHRVYGVDGLRVVDGSNLPFQVSSHLMSVLFGLAERAAELIAADNEGGGGPGPEPTPGTAIHPVRDATKCLEVSGSLQDGAPVLIADCGDSAAQKWEFASGNTAIKVAGQNFCLDAGENPADGARLKIWQCYEGLAAQSWSFANGAIKLQSADQCVDLTDGSTAPSNPVQTWQCYPGSENQQWTST
jgi:choline dehydrogenase-like flavoprotein